jgi:hypothetical protein
MGKKKPEGKVFLLLGADSRSSAAVTVMNKLHDGRIQESDIVYVQAPEPYKHAETGEDVEPQWGQYMLGERKEVELQFIAAHPEGHFLFTSGAIVPVAPTVAHLKEVEKAQKRGKEAAKKRAKLAEQQKADNAEREANLKAKRGKK